MQGDAVFTGDLVLSSWKTHQLTVKSMLELPYSFNSGLGCFALG